EPAAEGVIEVPPPPSIVSEAMPEAPAEPVAKAQPPSPPPPPPALPGPKLGDKVGFIQLPPKAGSIKPAEKAAGFKPSPRAPEPRRTEFTKRGDIRSVRGAPPPAGPTIGGTKFATPQKGAGKAPVAAPAAAAPKIALPADAQVISIKPPIVVRELAD